LFLSEKAFVWTLAFSSSFAKIHFTSFFIHE